MQNVMFAPKGDVSEDVVANALFKISRNILIVVLGLLPIFFVPVVYAPFNFSKILFVIIGVLTALIFYSLAVLRTGRIEFHASIVMYIGWALAGVVFLAAIFSGDAKDALFGDELGVHTAAFVGLMALIISVVSLLNAQKKGIMHLYMALTSVGVVIGLYHLVRLLFGPQVLSFGVFTGGTTTPIGGWNDLAIFYGLALLLALLAVEQFPLTKWGKAIFATVSVLSLIVLSVVNFFAIWIVLGLVSLMVLIYSLTKNRFEGKTLPLDAENLSGTIASVVLSVAVFIISLAFIIGGAGLGKFISQFTDVSYVEVRPSFEATIDITRGVYAENAFTGIGPNRFRDAWREHKDPAINQTIFWNTPFDAGIGYIPTFAATAGVFGIIAWLMFLGTIVYAGARVLMTTTHVDRFWYFVGTSSFVSALYLWGMSIIYVPGPTILILAAMFTGILFTTYIQIVPHKTFTLSLIENKRTGFALVALSMVVIVGSVSSAYFAARHYSGLLGFNQAVISIQNGTPIDIIEGQIASAFELSPSDRFAREIVLLQISKMNALMALPEPTQEQQEQFQIIVGNAINAGQLAVDTDPTEPLNWQSLGAVFSVLASVGIEGAYERASEAFANALQYDPNNPEIILQQAQLESRAGNLEKAKEIALSAIRLKRNYTAALFFLTQIDIALDDVPSAIESTRAMITLEPNNASRYYQLGILYGSNEQTDDAIAAFEQAVRIDPNYANARYFLALAYDQVGRVEDARKQLETVLALNEGNAVVTDLIGRLERGESLTDGAGAPETVDEENVTLDESGDVTTTESPDSPLLSPVNTVPDSDKPEEDASKTEEVFDESAPTE